MATLRSLGGHLWNLRAALGALLGHFGVAWGVLAAYGGDFGSILGLFWHMGWIAENLQKPKENTSFWVFWGGWNGAVTRKSGMGAMLVDLVAPFGVLRAIL